MPDDLVVEGVSRRFGGLNALRDVSFVAEAGRITALIGPNGAGKTTAFNCLSGLDRPDAGRVTLGPARLDGRPAHEVAALGVARTFQTLQVFANMSVLENVIVAAERAPAHGRGSATRERARRCLETADLGALADRPARALGFGEQRRLEFARALALSPRVLLLDEPASGLSRTEVSALAELVRGIRREAVTVVLIEHDVGTVMALADHVVVLDHGTVIAAGPPEAVRRDPKVLDAYLGAGAGEASAAPPEVVRAAGALAGAAGAAVRVRGLFAGHGDLPVLHDVDLTIPPAQVTALIGANGAGKSTLLSAVAGLLPSRGTVTLDGTELSSWPAERRAAAGLRLVPERRQLFERLTVEEHLLIGGYTSTGPLVGSKAALRRMAVRIDGVEQLFPRLAERRRQLAGTLSGGEQQMLSIARGLMATPRCLMLDEPLLGLSPQMAGVILRVLAGVSLAGLPVLLVEQNARAALGLARHAAVLERGRILVEGDASAVAADPRVSAAYFGG
jgi:branched-chain amino acid transport system ATP-binding protein/branched-chain amino acid transport system permease protein